MNLIKVLFLLFTISLSSGGRWEEVERIDLPSGYLLRDFIIDNRGDIYLSGNAFIKIDRAAKQTITIDENPVALALSSLHYGIILIKENGDLNSLNQDLAPHKLTQLDLPDLISGSLFEDSSHFYIALLFKNRLVIYRDGLEQNHIPLSVSEIAFVAGADYIGNQNPFYTTNNNRVNIWQGGNIKQIRNYREQPWIMLPHKITGIAVSKLNQIYLATPESIYIYNQQGQREEAIGSGRKSKFGRMRIGSTPDTIFIIDDLAHQIIVYVRKDRLTTPGPVYLEKNQPNPLESYTDIEFILYEPLDIKVVVYNLIGGPVKTLAQGYYNKGHYRIRWDGRSDDGSILPNGVYFYRLESKKGIKIRQLIIMK
ncbi:MAG: T9SS type A sorting domain-containing protein [candidate division WOR-3 bacterium]